MTLTSQPTGLYRTLMADLRAQHASRVNFIGLLSNLRRAGFSAVVLYRFSAACVSKGAVGVLLSRIFYRLNLWFNGCEIYPEAVIGPGLLLGHPTGVVIGRVRFGSNIRIQQNTTFGVRDFDVDEHDSASYPTLGDNIIVSAGAVLLGGIKVGNGVLIGANAVVLQDVPDNSVAVGVPARILDKSKHAGS